MDGISVIYVTGHRNPDADSIASAIGYAELKRRLDQRNKYVPVRLGEVNPQTRWLLERSEAAEPALLGHVMLRACDVMQEGFPVARQNEPVRAVGLAMAGGGLDLMPIVDDDGSLVGVMTERALARRYIRESRQVSALVAPTAVSAVVGVLEGDVVGDRSDAQRLAIEHGAALLVTSNGSAPSDEVMTLARERGTAVVSSPLD